MISLVSTSGFSCFDEIGRSWKGIYTPGRGYALAVIAAASFLLLINSSWRATPDSALYLELGESIARGKGYVFNGEQHSYVPPGYPAMVALVARICDGDFLGYRVLMAVLGLLTAAAGYVLVVRVAGPDTAFAVGGVFAVNHTLLDNSAFTTSDVPFALVSLLALNAVLLVPGAKKRVLWTTIAALSVGLPALIRVNGCGIPPAAAIFLFCSLKDRGRVERVAWTLGFLVVSVLPGAAWELYKFSFPSSFSEGTYLQAIGGRSLAMQAAVVSRSAWGYLHETTYALTALSLKTGFLELIVPFLALIGMMKAFSRGERLLVPLTVIQLFGLCLSPAGSRYIVVLIPGLYLFVALGILQVRHWMETRFHEGARRMPTGRAILVCFFVALAAVNVAHNMITIVQARTALERGGAESSRDLPFFKAARWLKDKSGGGVILTMHPRVIHYLSGLPSVELVRSGVPEHQVWVEQKEQIRKLILKHHPRFLFSDARNSRLLSNVLEAVKSLNLRLEEIHEARSSPRFRLWRILRDRR